MQKSHKLMIIPILYVIIGVIGGTLTGPLIFILPPLFYTRMRQLEKKAQKQHYEEQYELMMSDTELLIRNSSNYGTIEYPELDTNKKQQQQLPISKTSIERIIAAFVIIFGLAATLTSTYYNIVDIKGLNEFWSPCIQNISLSKFLLPK
jgi:solute carrier family 32 (vesicular inhibitory amino acid transporter)